MLRDTRSHFLPTSLYKVPGCGNSSRAFWSRTPSGKALVFVHGFWGHATTTWDGFPKLLTQEQHFNGHDLFFYSYDSVRTQVSYSAVELRQFLEVLLDAPYKQVVSKVLPHARKNRPANFSYSKVSLVGHSLGAVITRQAMLELANNSAMTNHLSKLGMVLAAPAHHGANVLDLAMEAMGPLMPLAPALQLLCPTLKELKSNSLTLSQLHLNTQTALATPGKVPLAMYVANAVAHGQRDRIVNANSFCGDPGTTPVPNVGHIAICKPLSPADTFFAVVKRFS